jgi:hypothetical protein
VVVVCALFATLAPFIFLYSLPFLDCYSGGACGPGEPGNTPLGSTLAVEYSGVRCTNDTAGEQCAYEFAVNYSSNVHTNDLRLLVEDPQGKDVSSTGNYAVLRTNLTGCSVVQWSFSASAWGGPSQDPCQGAGSPSPVKPGEVFELHPLDPGMSLSGKGLILVMEGVGADLSGTIAVPIP